MDWAQPLFQQHCIIICNLTRAIIYWIWHGLGWLYAYMLENNAKRPLLGPRIFELITVVGLQDMHSKIVVFGMVIIEYFNLFSHKTLKQLPELQSKLFWVKPKEENYRVLTWSDSHTIVQSWFPLTLTN